MQKLDQFTRSYVETALWSSLDDDGKPLDDKKYGIKKLAPATLQQMIGDCKQFQADHADDILEDLSRAGHDFWLTRNHHGAGFWDGDWPDDVGKRLTESSHVWNSVNLYVGDDGLIYDF